MKNKFWISSIYIIGVLVIGCAGKPEPIPASAPTKPAVSNPPMEKQVQPKQKIVPSLNPTPKGTESTGIPEWFLAPNTNIPDGFIGAVGTETSMDMQLAMEKAQNAARGLLRIQIEDIGVSGSDRFVKEVGSNHSTKLIKSFTSANQSASNAVLSNSKVELTDVQDEEGVYRVYVLVITENPEIRIVNELKMDEEIWIEFQKTEYFKDLNQRLENFQTPD